MYFLLVARLCVAFLWSLCMFDLVFVAVGGLAVEKLGKLSARGPCWCDIDPEKASPEHAHLRPSPTKEHEMEAPGPAGRI